MLMTDTTTLLKTALDEDIGTGDVTTNAIVPEDATLRGEIVAKSSGVISGLAVANQVFHALDSAIAFRISRVLKDNRGRPVIPRYLLIVAGKSCERRTDVGNRGVEICHRYSCGD